MICIITILIKLGIPFEGLAFTSFPSETKDMKLYTEQSGFSPAEIEFLSENTEIDVIPTERMDDVQLISVCHCYIYLNCS